jgi:hypothetical protein
MHAETTGCGAEFMARSSCENLFSMNHQIRTINCSVISVNAVANESKG